MTIGYVEGRTLWELLTRRVEATPDALMVVDEHDRRLTWAEFHHEAELVAAGLHRLGIGRGTVVTWQLPTRIDTVLVSMALSRLGAVQNPVIHLYRLREVESLVRRTRSSWYVHPGVWQGFDYGAMGATIDGSVTLLDISTGLPIGHPADLPAPPDPDSAADVRWLYATSGTTSEPKAVCHSDASLIAGGIGIATALHTSPPDIHGVPFPYADIGGPDNLVMSMRCGVAMALVERFVPVESFAFFARVGVTHLGGSTAHYLSLLAEMERTGELPVPTLRLMCGGGAPKPPEIYCGSRGACRCAIRHGYGMTECPMIAGRRRRHRRAAGQLGRRPVAGCEVIVVGPDGSRGPDGVDGDILVRGPMLAHGYLDAEETAEVFAATGSSAPATAGTSDPTATSRSRAARRS